MQYRPLGNTGVMVSFLGFSARYLPNPENRDHCLELIAYAFEKGINYFDVSPYAFNGQAELLLGEAVQEFARQGHACVLSGHTGAETELDFWHDLETSLKRLRTDTIDLYNIWRVRSWEDWQYRSERGVLKALKQAREEGMIRYTGFSTFKGDYDLYPIMNNSDFDVVSLGYSGLDFPFHESNRTLIKECGKGITVMNPFGFKPAVVTPEDFNFLKIRPEEVLEESALRFFLANDDINVLLTPFNARNDIDRMEDFLERFEHYTTEEVITLQSRLETEFGGVYQKIRELRNYPEHLEMDRLATVFGSLYNSKKPTSIK